MSTGTIVEIKGPIVDVRFARDQLPELLEAIKIEAAERQVELTVEVAQHLGDDVVRCVAMDTTDGLVRGMDAVSQGGPIQVPVGDRTLGRLFNVLGAPIDGHGVEE